MTGGLVDAALSTDERTETDCSCAFVCVVSAFCGDTLGDDWVTSSDGLRTVGCGRAEMENWMLTGTLASFDLSWLGV